MAERILVDYNNYNKATQAIAATTQVPVDEEFTIAILRLKSPSGVGNTLSKMGCVERVGKRGGSIVYERKFDPRDGLLANCRTCHYNQSGTSFCPIQNAAALDKLK